MKSVKVATEEEAVKPTVSDLGAQPGCSKKECKKESVEVKRQWSESSDTRFNNEGKKCVIM